MNALIIAPHVDDEAIGCWSVLTDPNIKSTVLYLFEFTAEREAEAQAASAHFGFDIAGNEPENQRALEKFMWTFDRVYVPSRRDWHEAHQQANRMWRRHATHYYSVDMARGTLLFNAEQKRQALDTFYPSQRTLWEGNDKYWLFEDIQELDYDVYKKLSWTQPDGRTLEVTVLAQHAAWVCTSWYSQRPVRLGELDKHDIDSLLSNVSGKVIIKDTNGNILEA